ncbi:hypothetical protein HPB51_000607 [Rhipicephalus microplus]|uniref:Uncharacterized protein n=1 Tax=Rhipicephalus microplus TaxID=6941 RepID=A0A9J6E5Y0_RHIMP|nr:hypothetical protein HPB51_000607 [Rhipicephalus microplus]
MASMSRATVYRRISHAVQADVHAILVAAGEGINAEENLSPIAFNPSQPEVPKPPPYRSLGPVSSAGVYGGLQESVEYQSDTYKRAKDKLITLQYTSDSNSGKELGRGKRKRKRALRYEDDDEDDSTDDAKRDQYVHPKAPTPTQRLSAHCAYQYRQVWLGLQGHTQKPRMLARWSANYGFYVLSTLHSSEAANFFTELQSHGSSHIPERSTLAAAARPHMEPRMFGVLTNDVRNPNATLKDVEKASMTWFRHASERLAAQQK